MSAGDRTLEGTWFVVRTSLPFWRRRTDPAVSYTPLPDGRVVDTVTWRSRGRSRQVIGIDVARGDGSWVWRGATPLTRLTSSRWAVLATGGDGRGWAVTHFERTLVTPEGIDVYARARVEDDDVRRAVDAVLPTLRRAAAHLDRLFVPERTH